MVEVRPEVVDALRYHERMAKIIFEQRSFHDIPLIAPQDLLDDVLAGTHVLPQEQLTQLVASGKLVSVTTFADHMRPDVHWIEPAEYGMAFQELIAGGDDMAGQEAAFTKADETYPGYINATLGLDEMVITVRADAVLVGQGAGETPGTRPGATAQLRLTLADWDAFLVQAQRVRGGSAE